MGGQILGGGVIVAVAVLLWIIYLLPSWQSRMRYNAAERNAVRLNQALRVLAETSEVPEEVRVELTAREARAQHKLVRQLRAEDDRVRAERDRAELERKRLESQAEVERARDEAEIERERRRRDLVLEAERRRAEAERLRSDPRVVRTRQAAARRRVRIAASIVLAAGLTVAGFGAWTMSAGGAGWWFAGGIVLSLLGMQALRRMAAVARRGARAHARAAASSAPVVRTQPVRRAVPQTAEAEDRGWTPRALPAPLTAVAGSRAATARAQLDAQEALRQAARAEGQRMREETAAREEAERLRAARAHAERMRAEQQRAVAADHARAERAAEDREPPAPVPITSARGSGESPYARMGYVDDAEIEAHVRRMLVRRATG